MVVLLRPLNVISKRRALRRCQSAIKIFSHVAIFDLLLRVDDKFHVYFVALARLDAGKFDNYFSSHAVHALDEAVTFVLVSHGS